MRETAIALDASGQVLFSGECPVGVRGDNISDRLRFTGACLAAYADAAWYIKVHSRVGAGKDECSYADGSVTYVIPRSMMFAGAVGVQLQAQCADGTVWQSGIARLRMEASVPSDEELSRDLAPYLQRLEGELTETLAQAETLAQSAEAFALGTRDGSAVGSEDAAYHANARYYAETALAGEPERIAAEAQRAQAETARQTAETLRAQAETARTSAESARASDESARTAAETLRLSAESARTAAETLRAQAEAEREEAESRRALFGTVLAEADGAICITYEEAEE